MISIIPSENVAKFEYSGTTLTNENYVHGDGCTRSFITHICIIRISKSRMRLVKHVASVGELRNANRFLVGKGRGNFFKI
jgi:hypothetical protein